ncbi:hypothetical protein SARC_09333 [Sphaeroforma arctica JP610]|uniref:Uncharacterized protein n=1 Tax=Sphaeroforma arctica JP610 TaxID=667725 RepID=A0A0L0FP20_9EUKA|nr:hypothetical protein SARC_09333 [Sphaeroforma arctica JP610]KNC78231.1 hypothetical protein SARC_09333 [Sphaeroforma arctica JP610]|eukprot:XP_014152133.1 hypothetical protein SARC_09333 [Sphaeroforma arctica JP610]
MADRILCKSTVDLVAIVTDIIWFVDYYITQNIRECLNDFAAMLDHQTLLPLINKLRILSNRLDDQVTQKEDELNILEELVMAEQLVPEQEALQTYFVKNLENKVAKVIQMLDEVLRFTETCNMV